MTGPPDRELLDAFLPEFTDALDRLEGAAGRDAGAQLLDRLRPMVSAMGFGTLEPALEAAGAALDPFDPAALGAAVSGARTALAALSGGAARPVTRTLVVDDSPTMRRIVREILAQDGAFEVVAEAADGEEALRLADEARPDLILLDLEMPGLDGFGFLRRWTLAGQGAVVVVSSAAAPGSAAARELRRLGVDAIVGKPSGALSFDLAERRGEAVLAAARRAAGLA